VLLPCPRVGRGEEEASDGAVAVLCLILGKFHETLARDKKGIFALGYLGRNRTEVCVHTLSWHSLPQLYVCHASFTGSEPYWAREQTDRICRHVNGVGGGD
jgi:hypothetical protein